MSKLSHVSDEKYHQFSSHHIFFSSIVSHFLMIKYLENGWTLSYGLESMHVLTVLNWMFYLWLNSDRNSSGRRQAHICDGNACIDWWMWHDIDTANRFINARYLYNARQHAFKHLVTNELTLFFSLPKNSCCWLTSQCYKYGYSKMNCKYMRQVWPGYPVLFPLIHKTKTG